MSSRWRERKGTVVSSAELQARRKALLAPVQKYRRAWVQVSAESPYKVLKWVPSSSVISTSNENNNSQAGRVISLFEDPTAIDDTTDEEDEDEDEEDEDEDEDEEEEEGEEEGDVIEAINNRKQASSAIPQKPGSPEETKRLKEPKINRKTSKVVEETEGIGGQLAGLETGEIAEQVEIDDEEESNREGATTDNSKPASNLELERQMESSRTSATQEDRSQVENLESIAPDQVASNGSNSQEPSDQTPINESNVQPLEDVTMEIVQDGQPAAILAENQQDYQNLTIPQPDLFNPMAYSSLKEDNTAVSELKEDLQSPENTKAPEMSSSSSVNNTNASALNPEYVGQVEALEPASTEISTKNLEADQATQLQNTDAKKIINDPETQDPDNQVLQDLPSNEEKLEKND